MTRARQGRDGGGRASGEDDIHTVYNTVNLFGKWREWHKKISEMWWLIES